MNDDERLILMKKRIIQSFKWRNDIVVPIAEEFGLTIEDMENIFMNRLDMSSIEALHSTFDSAKYISLQEQFYIDLRLHWLSDALNLITQDEAENIKLKLANEVYFKGRKYRDVLNEGRDEILQMLKED